MIEWNRKINLTGLHNRQRIIYELFLDSLIPSPHIPEKGHMLDIGSGAGFPGLPIKICHPFLKTNLMEARSKRVHFLRHIIRSLELSDIDVIKGRIERDVNLLHPKGYDIITARALANMEQLIEWSAPLLSHGGSLVGFLGSEADEILSKCRYLMELHSLILYKIIRYTLPGAGKRRTTVILIKNRVD